MKEKLKIAVTPTVPKIIIRGIPRPTPSQQPQSNFSVPGKWNFILTITKTTFYFVEISNIGNLI